MQPQQQEDVRALLNVVIIPGQTYPQKQPLSQAEFSRYWLSQDAFVVRASFPKATSQPQEVLGAFDLKPNFPGWCSHICNAGFIVQLGLQSQGIGRFMGESMLLMAASLVLDQPKIDGWRQALGAGEAGEQGEKEIFIFAIMPAKLTCQTTRIRGSDVKSGI